MIHSICRSAEYAASRRTQDHFRKPLTLERLEDRLVLSQLLNNYQSPLSQVGSTGDEQSGFTFFVTRIDGLSGAIDQQIFAANERLVVAGLTDGKIVDSMGSQGLFLLRTTNEIDPDELNRDLSTVQGYEYLQAAEGNEHTGEVTRVLKGGLRVNPLVFLTRTRANGGPLSPPGAMPLVPPTILNSFEGLDADDNPFLLSPPDTIVAAGPGHVVEAVNIALRIFDKSGTMLSTQLLSDFFSPVAPNSPFDPLVTYDTIAERWIIAAASFNASGGADFVYAVSNTSNPLDGFADMHKIEFGFNFFDFPKVGFNADAVLFTGNLFGAPGLPNQIIAVDKASLLDANPATVTEFMTQRFNFRAMVPATMHGAAPGSDTMYFVEERSYGDGDFVRVVKMTDVLSAAPTYTNYDIDVNNYGFPPAAQQPGGFINTNDTTFLNADWRNGRLVAAHSVGDFSDFDAHAAWYEFDAADSSGATPSLIQEGRLDPGDDISTYYPSVAISAGGAIGMTYMQSSPIQYASMYVTGRTPGDVAGTVREPALIAEGEDFLDGFFRAGDYSGITVDPVDGATFWAANEYKAVGAFWSTAIAQFSLGMAVTTTSPANSEIVTTKPTEYIVDFSEPFDPSPGNIDVTGMTVNGLPATAYSIVDADTLSFTFAIDPVTAQGLQTLALAAGTVERLSDGDPLQPYSGTFRYDVLPMQVTSTVPADGSVAAIPLNKITVNLNEPYAPASVGTDDLTLSMGSVTGFSLVDADTIDYLVSGISQEGTLDFSVGAGVLTDVHGNPNLSYSASVTLDFGTVSFPTPTSIAPSGSLIYETAMSGNILPAGDSDSFTISVDPGQTLTVIVDPAGDSLRPAVTLSGPGGSSSATAAAAGQQAVIQTVGVPSHIYGNGAPKTYTVTVSGFGGTTGGYTVSLILNAAAELENHAGATNNTLATAQSLDGSWVLLNTANPKPDRAAALGRVRGGPQPGDAYVGVRSFAFFGGNVVRYDINGNLAQTISNPVLATGVISDVELGPDNTIYVALSTDFFGSVVKGELAKFDLEGNYLGSVPLPDDSNIGFLYPFGFDVAPDGSIWVPQLNSGNLLHVSSTGTELARYFIGFNSPEDAAVRADDQVLVSQIFSPDVLLLDPGSGSITPFAFDPNFNPVMLNLTASGDLWLGDFFGPTRFDATGTLTQFIPNFATLDPQNDPSGNIWVAAFFNGVWRFGPAGEFQLQSFPPDGNALGLAVAGIDSASPLPTADLVDYYKFTLEAGRSATIGVNLLSGPDVTVELQDASGATIAIGNTIDDFIAPATGTYYIKISGAGSEYSVVVTRNAEFDTGANDSIATADDVVAPTAGGRRFALGYAKSGPDLDSLLDLRGTPVTGSLVLSGAPITLGINPDGSFITSDYAHGIEFLSNEFVIPGTPLASFTIAADGVNYTNAGAIGVTNIVVTLEDLSSGTFHGVRIVGEAGGLRLERVVAFEQGNPFATIVSRLTNIGGAIVSNVATLENIDPDQGEPLGVGFNTSNDVVLGGTFVRGSAYPSSYPDGLTIGLGVSEHGVVSAEGFFNTNPFDILDSPEDPNGGFGDIAINAAYGFGNLAPGQTVVSAVTMSFGVSPGESDANFLEGGPADNDFYRVNVDGGKTLVVETLTPAGNSGQFVNLLDPALYLYDALGNLLASNDNGAPDGRNSKLTYAVPAGPSRIYYIKVGASPLTETEGEYIVSFTNTQAVLSPFEVDSTVPPNGATFYTPPTDITVNFNDQFNATTVQASDLKIDGNSATGVTINDGDTATFANKRAYSHNGHYYVLTFAAKNWNDAQAEAAALGGNLVTINSQAEQDFLKRTLLSDDHRFDIYWIGLNDNAVEGAFEWASGEPVTYTNWGPGEPNDAFPGEDAAVINWYPEQNHGAWNDYFTDQLLYGIVELNTLPAGWWLASEGTHSVTIAAGAIKDLQGTSISAYSGTFVLDYTPPKIVGSSIQDGDILPAGDLSYTVTFSEALNNSFVDIFDFALVNSFRGQFFYPSSFSFDATTTVLTLNYANLPDDSYTLTLYSNPDSFVDGVGLHLDGEALAWPIPPNITGDGFEGGDFVLHFLTDYDTRALPVPLVAVDPPGSQVYRTPSDLDATIVYAGDTDGYTINLDPDQRITVLVDPAGDPPPTLYAGIGNGSFNAGSLLEVSQTTGFGTFIADPVTPGGLTGLVYDPSSGFFLGSTIQGFGSTSKLVRIDPVTGALLATIGQIKDGPGGPAISIGDLAIQPGTSVLYGVRSNADGTGNGGMLYTIDKATGVATFVGNTNAGAGGGISFAPDGTLYQAAFNFFFDFTSLNEISPVDASRISTIPISGYFDGLAVRPSDGLLFAAPGGPSDATFTIDPATGATTIVGFTGQGGPSDLAFAPFSSALAPILEIQDPWGAVLASTTAGQGQNAILQNVPTTTGGTYTINVGGAAGTTGLYTVRLVLNAVLEGESNGGSPNDTLATAQALDSALVDQGRDMARAAVLGTSDGAGGYEATAIPFTFNDISGTGTTVLQGVDDSFFGLTAADLSGFEFPFYGTTYTDLFFSSNGLITFGSPNSDYFNTDLTSYPSQAAVAVLWDDLESFSLYPTGAVYWEVQGAGSSQQLILQWQDMRYYCCFGDTVTFQAVLSEADGSIQFNYLDLSGGVFQDEGATATVGIKDAGTQGSSRLLLALNNGPNSYVGSGQSTLIAPTSPPRDYYAVDLTASDTVTIVLADLDGTGLAVELVDSGDNVLAAGVDGRIDNFLVPGDATYYLRVSGVEHDYNLVLNVNAAFDNEPNDTQADAQPIAGNNGALGAIVNNPITLGVNFEGITGSGSSCGCLPPDTNAAVGNNFIVETVNTQIRIFNKTTGDILLDESLGSFFGEFSAGDPFAVYDDVADRWYIVAFDSTASGLFLAVSVDGDPTTGFLPTYHLAGLGFPDYPKLGFNYDAIFISYNDFSTDAGATIAAVDKAAALSGTLTYYISKPEFQFRALPPAQMHGDTSGGVEWFVSTNGSESAGDAIRVTKMENYLSNSPIFTYTALPVTPYFSASIAEQPGGFWTTFPNTTTYQVDYRDGSLVTAMATAFADTAGYPKGVYYQIDTSGASPLLVREGRIDPGPGVAVQMPSVAQDINGNLGFTWMQGSSTEFVSMYVGVLNTTTNSFGSAVVAPGVQFFSFNFRIGDYSTTVLDPTDGLTFWAANEYSGTDFLWNTQISSFQASPQFDYDWYDVDVPGGYHLVLSIDVPAAGLGEFANNLVPRIEVYDSGGVLFDSAEGIGAVLITGALGAGTYSVRVSSVGDAGGEYVLSAAVAAPLYASSIGAGTQDAGALLRVETLMPVIATAALQWSSYTGQLGNLPNKLDVSVADLPDSLLGLASRNSVWFDRDAAGFGWFIDRSPSSDLEFTALSRNRYSAGTGSAAFGRMDLLAVVSHELGHLLGLEHSGTDSLMGETLQPGFRLSAVPVGGVSLESGGDGATSPTWSEPAWFQVGSAVASMAEPMVVFGDEPIFTDAVPANGSVASAIPRRSTRADKPAPQQVSVMAVPAVDHVLHNASRLLDDELEQALEQMLAGLD
jgi:hypothetical protein